MALLCGIARRRSADGNALRRSVNRARVLLRSLNDHDRSRAAARSHPGSGQRNRAGSKLMPGAVFFVTFFGLLASGLPIFIVLGICAAALFALSSQPLVGVAQLIVDHLNSPTLMSLPLFVMAATFMRVGGVEQALVNLAIAWLGGIRGALGLVTVVSCT